MAAVPAGTVLAAVEKVAWRMPGGSRRFFLAIALIVAVTVAAGGLAAAVVSARNAAELAEARDRGLRIATSVTEFRGHLSAADAVVAATLVSGEPETPVDLAHYQAELLQAGLALTDAGLLATGRDAEDIAALAAGLVRYADLIDTSRYYPVGSTFSGLARSIAHDDLIPTADRVLRAAELRMVRAADRVGGPVGTLVIAVVAAALGVLVGAAALVAGRTRRLAHPMLAAATVVLAANLVILTVSLWPQGRELRAAAQPAEQGEYGEIDAFLTANAAAFALYDLRVTELDAVASGADGQDLYAQFQNSAAGLIDRLSDQADPADGGAVLEAVRAYVAGVAEVEALDAGGDNVAAGAAALDGGSAIGYREARSAVVDTVNRSAADLTDRLEVAADANVEPLLPLGLGILAAGLAAAGVLARGRSYR